MGNLTTCCGGPLNKRASATVRDQRRPVQQNAKRKIETPKRPQLSRRNPDRSESNKCLIHGTVCPCRPGSPPRVPALGHPCAIGLYSERFHGLLTLSSECFSTFPLGTCSLSVLWIYLALDRVYDLLSAAIPGNATLGKRGRTHTT